MRVKIKSEEVFIHTISDEDYSGIISLKKKFSKSCSYRRSRYLLESKKLKYPSEKYKYSISHANNV